MTNRPTSGVARKQDLPATRDTLVAGNVLATKQVGAVDQAAQSLYGFDVQTVETIKNTVAKGATNHELALFLYTARKLGLDPLLGQIWFVKYAEGKPSIQVGRDGFLSTAQKDEGFETPISQAVYSKDEFELDVAQGYVKHIIKSPADRGVLLGAYCIAPHKTRKPVVTWVSYEEYARAWGQRNPVWRSNPAEMIRKVAESQSLRRQYANMGLGAVYVKDEFGPCVEGDGPVVEQAPPPSEKVSFQEYEALLTRAREAGVSGDEVMAAFRKATGRAIIEGWSRNRAEFEAWQVDVEALIAEKAKAKADQPEAKAAQESQASPTVDPSAPACPEDVQRVIALASKMPGRAGDPAAWLKASMGVEVSQLTQSQVTDLITYLEEQAKAQSENEQTTLL